MFKQHIIIIIFCFFICQIRTFAQQEATLYINRGSFSIGSQVVYRIAFNNSTEFHHENAVLDFVNSESIILTIVNNDSVAHAPYINRQTLPVVIEPGESVELNIELDNIGTYLLLSDQITSNLLGGSAMLRIGIETPRFHWDLWEQEAETTEEIVKENQNELSSSYRPNVFTMNGLPYSFVMNESTTITGMVGQEIYISVCNSGNMTHTLHFHGYHVEIVQAVVRPEIVGWEKDSFPVLPKESMTLKLVPHQPGSFPVHNHNLVTLLTNNGYPGGMLTMIMIMP
jgi:FtsP/CotA-like multicopper oxidase with cupredoxin domain